MLSNKNFAIGVTIAAVLIFAASFMPWGQIQATPTFNMQFGENSLFADKFFSGVEITMTMTGWNGSITLGGLSIPHWLVVLVSAGVAVLCWLKATSVWVAPQVVFFLLAAYGLVHAGIALIALMASGKGSPGIGLFLTILAFIGMLLILVRQAVYSKAPKG
jgi:hypothetical protein